MSRAMQGLRDQGGEECALTLGKILVLPPLVRAVPPLFPLSTVPPPLPTRFDASIFHRPAIPTTARCD